MALFAFHMMGNCRPQMLETSASSVDELLADVSGSRFIEAEAVSEDGVIRKVILQTSRIELIVEAD